ncbi:MAG: DUF4860 domain-containing protein [Lachnospiraceae bacterium]|nr:DUF4860 domain-containing protein [Lachnospiraceae bacterium]
MSNFEQHRIGGSKAATGHTVDVLFVITLFLVFAVSVVMLTGTGARVYQNIVDSMTENFDSRTSFTYVINKIHQNDRQGAVSLGSYEGLDAVLISEEVSNVNYCTYLYFYDGYMREIFTRYGSEFDPALGTPLFALESFTASEVTETLFRFDIVTPGGNEQSLFVHLNSNR